MPRGRSPSTNQRFDATETYRLEIPDGGGLIVRLTVGAAEFWVSSGERRAPARRHARVRRRRLHPHDSDGRRSRDGLREGARRRRDRGLPRRQRARLAPRPRGRSMRPALGNRPSARFVADRFVARKPGGPPFFSLSPPPLPPSPPPLPPLSPPPPPPLPFRRCSPRRPFLHIGGIGRSGNAAGGAGIAGRAGWNRCGRARQDARLLTGCAFIPRHVQSSAGSLSTGSSSARSPPASLITGAVTSRDALPLLFSAASSGRGDAIGAARRRVR